MITAGIRNGRASPSRAKLGHVRVSEIVVMKLLSEIRPSLENDKLYRPVDPAEQAFLKLVASVREHGILDPLVISTDGKIMSGHRRYAAARVIGLNAVPSRVADIHSSDPRFLELLEAFNRQRVKSLDEVLREEVVAADPEEAYRLLTEHRRRSAEVPLAATIELRAAKRRPRITDAKKPFLDAILRILRDYRDCLPLSVRQIHYYLLNFPPLIHASKPHSTYQNDLQSYKALDELLTRARFDGTISFDAIHDSTRPVVTWDVWREAGPFIGKELDKFLKGYYRDLQQSQPNHIEIIGEKNTIQGVIRPVALEFRIPYTIGRGYSSVPPRHAMAKRFRRSGKERLILLSASDFDPEGEDLGRAFAQSMHDDFDIKNILPIKVALTAEQVRELNLPPKLKAKEKSSRRKGFVERHGENTFELEAIPPKTLQRYLREAIEGVLDRDAFNAEIALEKKDAAFLDRVRRQAHATLGELDTEGDDDPF
jgi:hypothetical protein